MDMSPTIVERLKQQAGLLTPQIDDWRATVGSVIVDPVYYSNDSQNNQNGQLRSNVREGDELVLSGLYANLFEVKFEEQDVGFMHAKRSQFPKLLQLRQQLDVDKVEAQVYAVDDLVYGYGVQQDRLANYGFAPIAVRIGQIPQLTARLIIEGYAASLRQAGYTCEQSFGRLTAFQFGKALLDIPLGVKLYRGNELQSIYLLDPETELLTYLIIVDPIFTYRDPDNQPLSTHAIVAKFGHEILQRLRMRQGDFAPHGGINLEVSRQRLEDLILPFIKARHQFTLHGNIIAELNLEPVRIVLAG